MPRVSTSPSLGGSGEDDQESPLRLTYKRGELAEDVDGMGGDEEPGPAAVRSDLVDSDSQGSDNDEISTEPAIAPKPTENGVKRKRGRPPKSATKPQASGNSSKDKPNTQRRSNRIVAKGKTKIEGAPAQGATGRKRAAASMTSRTHKLKGEKNASASKAFGSAQEKEWEVKEVVGTRIDNASSEMLYLVQWKGFSSKDNTWEPTENLGNCQGAIKRFEARQMEALQKPAAKKRRTMKG